jgi:hypothetical protein
MNNLLLLVQLGFGATLIWTLYCFFRAVKFHRTILIITLTYLAIQCIVGLSGFYQNTNTIPPRLIFLISPAVLSILVTLSIPTSRSFLLNIDTKSLLMLHTTRIPVELVLYGLFTLDLIPEMMTFSGINYDILSGISASLLLLIYTINKRINRIVFTLWNLLCLGLLFNIVYHGILSAPGQFQQFSFDQPNIGLLFFPFMLLPGCIVPLVLFSHITLLLQLWKTNKTVPTN